MTLEQQCCSLELAKELKALGVKQESLFRWSRVEIGTKETHRDHWGRYFLRYDAVPRYFDDTVCAFTVAELGEMMLLNEIGFNAIKLIDNGGGWLWEINYKHIGDVAFGGSEKTEADARAKTLIHLIKNGLIDPKKV